MEFDNSLREDFPFLSSFFSDNPLKPADSTNGFSVEASSSKELVHEFQHFDDHHHHHFPISGFTLNPDENHVDDHHFNVEGSSSDPLAGIQAPWASEEFLKDFNAYASTLLASDGNMHGFENSVGLWDNDPQKNLVLPLNIQELGSADVRLQADDVSCITLENGYHRSAAYDEKKRKRVNIRKATKIQKKSNIIKGQWTLQEDRYIYTYIYIYTTFIFWLINFFNFLARRPLFIYIFFYFSQLGFRVWCILFLIDEEFG
jgi:myb proto-oncogene protein